MTPELMRAVHDPVAGSALHDRLVHVNVLFQRIRRARIALNHWNLHDSNFVFAQVFPKLLSKSNSKTFNQMYMLKTNVVIEKCMYWIFR